MSANRIRKKKPSTVRFNYVQGITQRGTVKFNKVDVPVLPDPTPSPTRLARNEASPEVAPNHLASSDETLCNDTDEAVPDVLYHQDNIPGNCESTDDELEDTSDENLSHFTKKKKRVKAWETIRNQLRRGAVTSVVIPSGTPCKICGDNLANVYCKQCGLQAFFCEQCCHLLHTTINIFHTPVIQVVCIYVYGF